MLHQPSFTAAASRANWNPSPAPDSQYVGLFAGHPGLVVTEFSYGRNESLYGEGEPAEYVYQVVRGAVRSYRLLSDGRRLIGAFHLPGDIFGLEPDATHRLTAEAIVGTSVRMIRRKALEALAKADVQVACALWTMTAGDLRHAEGHMLLLGRKTAAERVATFLLEMDRRLSKAGMFALPMGRGDIADYLGLTLETVSRTLSQLHGEGILGFAGAKQITLRDRSRLANMDA